MTYSIPLWGIEIFILHIPWTSLSNLGCSCWFLAPQKMWEMGGGRAARTHWEELLQKEQSETSYVISRRHEKPVSQYIYFLTGSLLSTITMAEAGPSKIIFGHVAVPYSYPDGLQLQYKAITFLQNSAIIASRVDTWCFASVEITYMSNQWGNFYSPYRLILHDR